MGKIYTIKDIDDYQDRLTEKQSLELVEHCNKFGISPNICAWYDNLDDFYIDWVYDNEIDRTEAEAYDRLLDGKETGEFKEFDSGEIVRISL